MDFSSSPIKGQVSSVIRSKATKPSPKPQKSRFKASTSSEANSLEEPSSLQTFSVTSLDSALLDLSRSTSVKEIMDYGKDLLDKLDNLKGFLLLGRIPESELNALKESINKQKHTINDPCLHKIIQEIEVRVAVELAKLQK